MKYCPDCGRPLNGQTRHPNCNPHSEQPSVHNDTADMLTSAAIGYATNSALLGTVLGGDPVGAILGDMLNTSDNGIGDAVSNLFD